MQRQALLAYYGSQPARQSVLVTNNLTLLALLLLCVVCAAALPCPGVVS